MHNHRLLILSVGIAALVYAPLPTLAGLPEKLAVTSGSESVDLGSHTFTVTTSHRPRSAPSIGD